MKKVRSNIEQLTRNTYYLNNGKSYVEYKYCSEIASEILDTIPNEDKLLYLDELSEITKLSKFLRSYNDRINAKGKLSEEDFEKYTYAEYVINYAIAQINQCLSRRVNK